MIFPQSSGESVLSSCFSTYTKSNQMVSQQPMTSRQACTHQSYSLQPFFESFLSLSLSENRLQPADELCSEPLRLYVDVLWHAVRALNVDKHKNYILRAATIHSAGANVEVVRLNNCSN